MLAWLFILLNPFNLVALYFAFGGLAMWGVGSDYRIDFSLYTLFKVFGIPTLAFGISWFALRRWKNISNLKVYALSSVTSFLMLAAVAQIYWAIIGRSS